MTDTGPQSHASRGVSDETPEHRSGNDRDGAAPGPSSDPRLVALARDVERLARRQARLAGLADELAELDTLVRRLAEDVALVLPHGADEPAALRSWLTPDPSRAAADLVELAEWVGAVYLRYPDAELPSCWAWHPAVVEELWWLRHAHHDAYAGRGASWREVGDWHDRQRPGVVRRVNRALGDCDLNRHSDGGDRRHDRPVAPLADHLAVLAEHWSTHRATPSPTDQQLTEADQHDRSQLRTRR